MNYRCLGRPRNDSIIAPIGFAQRTEMTDLSNVVRVAISGVLPKLFRPVRTVMTWVTGTHSLSTISGIPRIRTLSWAFSGTGAVTGTEVTCPASSQGACFPTATGYIPR